MGAKYGIRGPQPGPDATMLQRWNWAKELFSQSAEIAEKYGVTLALQNHHPFIMHSKNTYLDMLDMVAEVGSEHLKCSLDCGLLNSQENDYVAEAVRKTGDLQVISHCFGEFARDAQGKAIQVPIRGIDSYTFNYPAFVKTLKEIGYDGFLNFEFCHAPMNTRHEWQGIDFVHEQTELAQEYFRDLIGNA